MGHKCYISFKTEDMAYKGLIQNWTEGNKVDMIDKSLDEPIDSDDEDYIMRKIREDYLADSTVTIFLIGTHSSELEGEEEQRFIKRELQASLYDGEGNTRNGILGVVLPQMYKEIFQGQVKCDKCHEIHNRIRMNDATVIKEFWENYHPSNHKGCCYEEDDRYCVLVKWEDFEKNPNKYIEQAYEKRSQPIADKVVVRPK